MNRSQVAQRKVKSSSSLRIMERNVQYQSLRPPTSIGLGQDIESKQDATIIKDEDVETVSRLPQITELMNLKFKPSDRAIHEKMIELVKYSQTLENTIKFKDKQIQRLEYIVKYNQIGQQKRDIMIQIIQEENRKLREQISNMEQQVKYQQKSLEKSELMQIEHPKVRDHSLTKTKKNLSIQTVDKNNFRTRAREIQDDIVQGLLNFEVETNEQVNQRYSEIPHILQIGDLLGVNYDAFEQNLQGLTTAMTTSIFDALHQTVQEHKLMFQVMARLRNLIEMALQLSQQPNLTSSLEIVVKEACSCLLSDRASVFVYDQEKEQLWTRATKGQNVIRIPYNKGVVGHVFVNGDLVNIMNAYSDSRFDQNADKNNNYRTHTILSCPIRDPSNTTTLGVLQSINKLSGYFTKDDEKIIQLIASIAGISLKNALQFDEQVIYQNSLRSLLSVQERLCIYKTLFSLIQKAEQQLKEIYNVQLSKIFVVEGEQMYSFDQFGNKNTFSSHVGIAGYAVHYQQFLSIYNPYQHHLYNNQVDMETTLPLYYLAAREPEQGTSTVCLLQVINSRGIQSVSTQQKHKVASIDYEILNNFGQFLARKVQAILNDKQDL